MPTNVTPQYHKAEEAYRRATTLDEELKCLEVMLREMPKHKGSEKLQSEIKQKISRAKKEQEAAKKTPSRGHGVRIPRQGAGTAVLLGAPNAGKSQLLASLTRATPEIATYPFTTRVPLPGMMTFEDVQVQLIDTPPVTHDIFEPYMQGLIRGADLALLVLDLASDDGTDDCQQVLDKLDSTKTRLARTHALDDDDLGLSYTQTLLAANKIDVADASIRLELLHETKSWDFPEYVISAAQRTGLDALRSAIYGALDVIRVYTKLPHAKTPDYGRPFTIRRGGTLMDVAALVHKDFAENLKFARVWGANVHDGTVAKGDHVLSDKDVVELHI
ncbi:MAG: 50S ribosome-binding GTPase [Planctomycetia bacterium]|nr:50S ribosome-binding GTPase [Planctomycetia bacterium]